MIWPTMKRTRQKLKRPRKEPQPGLKLCKRKKKFSFPAPSTNSASRFSGASGSFPPAGSYFRPQGRYSGNIFRGSDLCFVSSAPYVFTKVVRQLVKYWRGRGDLILVYLDDGIGGHMSVERSRILSDSVRQDLASSGFTANDDKSMWVGTYSEVSFPGIHFRFWRSINSNSSNLSSFLVYKITKL